MAYIDAMVAAVPTANKDAFLKHAREIDDLFIKHGATKIMECWGDDVPDGVQTSFPMSVKKEANETVVISYIAWPSKAVRDAGWKTLMAEPAMQPDTARAMPFDGKRMIYGGFDVILEV